MYSDKELSKYEYFNELLQTNKISYLLDPLTGVISREIFISFVKDLITNNIPFTLSILDLDNFKAINDNYGHNVGDAVLLYVANGLKKALDKVGIVGRFGGDEFIYVDLVNLDYKSKHDFLYNLYGSRHAILRKSILFGNCRPFISGTIGCTTYPNDAKTYDELFENADKTLYKGKVKGRNCYIIYVEEKHKNITVQKLVKEDLYMQMYRLSQDFERAPSIMEKLNTIYLNLVDISKIQYLLYIDKTGTIFDCASSKMIGMTNNFKNILGDIAVTSSNLSNDSTTMDYKIHKEIKMVPAQSLLISRIYLDNRYYGHLICTDQRNSRIWQPDEKALMYFITKCLVSYLFQKGN